MPRFSAKSASRLAECHKDLQAVMNAAIIETDFTVLCGHRGQAEQDAAVAAGKSKLRWPKSKHNARPSLAVDVAPWPLDWNDRARFKALAKVILAEAKALGISLRWGGDWNSDGDDSDGWDLPHFELR